MGRGETSIAAFTISTGAQIARLSRNSLRGSNVCCLIFAAISSFAWARYPLDDGQLRREATLMRPQASIGQQPPRRAEVDPWVWRPTLKPHSFGRFPTADAIRNRALIDDFSSAGIEVLYLVAHHADSFTSTQLAALREAVQQAHALRMKVGLYTGPFGLEKQEALEEFPILKDWLQVDCNGKPVRAWGEFTFCPLSPYPLLFRLRLVEYLVKECDFDGAFLDIPWFFSGACYCTRCCDSFRRFVSDPEASLPALDDFHNPLFPPFVEWRYTVIRDVLEAFALSLKSSRPDFFYMANYNVQHSRLESFHTYGLYPLWANPSADCVLTELTPFRTGEPQWLVGAMIGSAQSETKRPVYHALVLDQQEQVAPPVHVLNSYAEVLAANGTLMHRYPLSELALGPKNRPFIAALTKANTFLRKYRDLYAAGRSLAPQAVVYSRASAVYSRDPKHPSFGGTSFTVRFLHHFWGAYLACMYSQSPTDVLSDDQIDVSHLAPYGMVILPQTTCFDTADMEALLQYVRRGGTAVASGICGRFDKHGVPHSTFPAEWPLRFSESTEMSSASAEAVEYRIGSGSLFHYPGPVDRSAWEAPTAAETRKLTAELAGRLGPRRLISLSPLDGKTTTMPLVHVSAYEQSTRIIIHLVNYSSPEFDFRGVPQPSSFGPIRFVSSVNPIGPFDLELYSRDSLASATIYSLDDQTSMQLPLSGTTGHYRVRVPRLETYSVVSFEGGAEFPWSDETLEDGLDLLMQDAVAGGLTASAALAIGTSQTVAYNKVFGYSIITPEVHAATTATLYDLASLTKVVGTSSAIMKLVEQQKLSLDDPVSKYLPDWACYGKEAATIRHLMTHSSGLSFISGNAPSIGSGSRDYSEKLIGRLCRYPCTFAPPGTRFFYTDGAMVLAGAIVERASGRSLDEFLAKEVFAKLGMYDTTFNPVQHGRLLESIAATAKRSGKIAWGEVHDPTSYRMGGVSGNAGLFSSSHDLILFSQMILGKGIVPTPVGQRRVFDSSTVEEWTRIQLDVPSGKRAIGWDVDTTYSIRAGFPLGSFGHTGFTGTSIWIDPKDDIFVVLLTNRLHPKATSDDELRRLRLAVHGLAAARLLPTDRKTIGTTSSMGVISRIANDLSTHP